MLVRLTHLAAPTPDLGQRHADALGIAEEGGEPRRFFLPGWLPCGECGRCRRALVAACANGRPLLTEPPTSPVSLDVPDRFLTPVDVPAEGERLPDEIAAAAGSAAALLDATASAGLTPGDVAIWIGAGGARLGAAFSAARGCSAFWLSFGGSDAQVPSGVVPLPPDGGAEAWRAALAGAEATGPPGRRSRRLFATAGARDWPAVVAALADPGATIALLTGSELEVPARLALPARARVLALGGYHPDLVPEALAALHRDEVPAAVLRAAGVVTVTTL